MLLNHYYMLFADQFGFLNWSYSKVGLGLFEYSDTVSPTEAVGYYLTGNEQNSANTGMIGFGFLNAGHAGVAVYLAVFLAILAASSALSREKGIEMLGAAIMVRRPILRSRRRTFPQPSCPADWGIHSCCCWSIPHGMEERREPSALAGRRSGLSGADVVSGFAMKRMPRQRNG